MLQVNMVVNDDLPPGQIAREQVGVVTRGQILGRIFTASVRDPPQ